jgi:hypothetical protein
MKFNPQIFGRHSNTKFHENTSSRSKVVCEEEQTDMTKLIVSSTHRIVE